MGQELVYLALRQEVNAADSGSSPVDLVSYNDDEIAAGTRRYFPPINNSGRYSKCIVS